jgi:hypothetical protein
MKRFTATKHLSTASAAAVALVLLGAAGTVPAFAQSRDHTGSMLPFYYDSTGEQITGAWGPPAAPSIGSHSPLYLKVETFHHRHPGAGQGRH